MELTWAGMANTYWVVDRVKDVAFGESLVVGICERR